ncbi:hypothetical protein FF100_20875 [Methylobacterium terricola]|uniref:Uncharacterized protein n=1 Tax=Methylobacterium terricola TaxID=2583531 RepID=A0A5C4LD70_9HYPH|nr:hypothetical protein [Methylobacterium terricola]TNC11058.1 hypothetical protein FF100_20875 [Methylobacterium terricola]
MAAVILPFALAAGRQVQGPAPQDPAPRDHGWMTVDLDGAVSPLRGKLPDATGRFPGPPAAQARRVPAEAILAIGRRMLRSAPAAQDPAPARPRMPRKHKLMLLTAAAVLYTGGMEARRHFKPRAVLIEVPSTRANAIAALPVRMPAA